MLHFCALDKRPPDESFSKVALTFSNRFLEGVSQQLYTLSFLLMNLSSSTRQVLGATLVGGSIGLPAITTRLRLSIFTVSLSIFQKHSPVYYATVPVNHFWQREQDLNLRSLGYEPSEMPCFSIPRLYVEIIIFSPTCFNSKFYRYFYFLSWTLRQDSNLRSLAYEASEIPLLHGAINGEALTHYLCSATNYVWDALAGSVEQPIEPTLSHPVF